jgi:hypothetical protein
MTMRRPPLSAPIPRASSSRHRRELFRHHNRTQLRVPTKALKIMISKEQFIQDLRPSLLRSVAWRSRQAQRFPCDLRNRKAASMLAAMARSEPSLISEPIWEHLQRFIEPGGCYRTPKWNDALSETARHVAFHGAAPESLNEFLDDVLIRLTSAQTGGAL